MSIKKQIADAILEKPIEINILGRIINAPRPTLGTMIEVSKLINDYDYQEFTKDDKNFDKIIGETLRIAKNWEGLAEILAWLLLGKNKALQELKIFGIVIYIKDNIKPLKNEILNKLTPKEIAEAIFKICGSMECGFFLSTIGFLNNINHLKKTKN